MSKIRSDAVKRAAKALLTIGLESMDNMEQIMVNASSIITDIMHLCCDQGLDFEQIERNARQMFDDEVEEMEKETLPRLDEKKLAAIVDSLVKGDASEHD